MLLETALAAGAQARLATPVTAVLGGGSKGDPVCGVSTAGGDSIRARWVVGADGRGSKVAGALGLKKARTMQADTAMMFAYWRGLPDTRQLRFDVESDGVLHRPAYGADHRRAPRPLVRPPVHRLI